MINLNSGIKKVLCVGFSVTEDKNGYVSYLSKDLDRLGVELDTVSLGGATFEILPYILPEYLSANKGSIILFEIATCYRFKGRAKDYEEILNEIYFLCRKYECKPIFVNMFREGVDFQKDVMSTTIEFLAKKNGFKYIDLITSIANQKDKETFLRDGVHTTDEGARYYAEKISSSLIDVVMNGYETWKSYELFKLSDLVEDKEISTFKRGGFESSYIDVNAGELLEVTLPKGYLICGLMYLMGPRTGNLVVNFENTGFRRTIHMYDERSYYTRCSYQFIPPQRTEKLTLEQKELMPTVKLIKGEENKDSRIGSVIGVMAIRDV